MPDEGYFDSLENEELTSKNPETSPQQTDDWPAIGGDKAPIDPVPETDPDAEVQGGTEP